VDEWYYELDGRTHGPLREAKLRELLECSGETAREVRVRNGKEGDWTLFRSATDPRQTRTSYSEDARQIEPHRTAGPSVLHRGRLGESLKDRARALLLRHWDLAAGIAIWAMVNLAFVLFWPGSYAQERRDLETLKQMSVKVQELRAKQASDVEWREFRERALPKLQAMAKDLKSSASAAEPIRQHLLWAARDAMPKTLGPTDRERSEQDKLLARHLQNVEQELGR
jgi:hypothetical protein